jgi:nicotinate-nucleotide pyrophosphorylase (carboxylating)
MKLETIAQPLVRLALAEDIGGGDATTLAVVDENARGRAEILARENGVLAGLDVARLAFHEVDPEVGFERLVRDGARTRAGTPVARLAGRARSLLTAERVALNFLCHLSGIATLTSRFVRRVRETHAIILDTRKTLPGIRVLQKYAVLMGGGQNHRFGLFDMYLVKDNHARVVGSLQEAVARVQRQRKELDLEAEASTFEQVKEALEAGVDRILLDNMSLEQMATAVQMVDQHRPAGKPARPPRAGARRWPEIEVSGGVTLETVRAVAELGVDYISIGALTHSAPALDLSLEVCPDG